MVIYIIIIKTVIFIKIKCYIIKLTRLGSRLSLRCTAHIGQVMIAMIIVILNAVIFWYLYEGKLYSQIHFASPRCTLPQHLEEQACCQEVPHLHRQEGRRCQKMENKMFLENLCLPPPLSLTAAPGGPSMPPSLLVFSFSSWFFVRPTRIFLHMWYLNYCRF